MMTVDEQIEELRRTIKNRRVALDMTQEQLSRKADVTLGTIYNIERGGKKPDLETILRVVRALDGEFDVQAVFPLQAVSETEPERVGAGAAGLRVIGLRP